MVLPAVAKLNFDGIEARCVTEHPDFVALTNTVLQQVGPLQEESINILEPVPRMLKMSKRVSIVACCAIVVQCSLCHYILLKKHRLFLFTAIPQAFNVPYTVADIFP